MNEQEIAAEQRKKDEERIYGRDTPAPGVSPELLARRKNLQAAFELVFVRHPNGEQVLAEIARICHFTAPALTAEDMVLQNAFKSILHMLGKWTDDRDGAEEIVHRLVSEVR